MKYENTVTFTFDNVVYVANLQSLQKTVLDDQHINSNHPCLY